MDSHSSFDIWDVFVILLALASFVLLLGAVPVAIGGLGRWLVRRRLPSSRFVRSCMVASLVIPVECLVRWRGESAQHLDHRHGLVFVASRQVLNT
jgi:hypothetical protein